MSSPEILFCVKFVKKQLSSLEILKRHYERKHADFIKFRQEKGLYSVEMAISNIIKVHTERGHPL